MSKVTISARLTKVFGLLKSVSNLEEATTVIATNFSHLSPKAAVNVAKDIEDFSQHNMELSELDYRLKQAGVEA